MLSEEQIVIAPYNPDWIKKFETEKKLLEKTLGDWITGGVHHVGSTSIPGISAKPVIDIMAGVQNLEEAKKYIPLLEAIEYCYYPYKPEEMIWFCKPSPYRRTHHLHLVEVGSKRWNEVLAFRDYLRSHPEAKEEYQKLKLNLAEKFKNDREAYTDAKTEFIKQIIGITLQKHS